MSRPTSDGLRLDEQLCFSLYRASRALIRAYGPFLKPLDLTYPQYLVMLVLWEQDNPSVRELGERLALDSATLTPLIKRMEKRGLAKKQRDENDERVVRICCTREGYALRQQAARIPPQLICLIGEELAASEAARKRLRQTLDALSSNLAE